MNHCKTFEAAYRGNFTSLLRWQQLDEFWEVVRGKAGAGWHIYAVGMPVPTRTSASEAVIKFIAEVNTLLRNEHREDYCGIVYTDSKESPSMIKIFDPNYLGISCGFSNHPPLPGRVLGLTPPQPLESKRLLSAARQYGWQRLCA